MHEGDRQDARNPNQGFLPETERQNQKCCWSCIKISPSVKRRECIRRLSSITFFYMCGSSRYQQQSIPRSIAFVTHRDPIYIYSSSLFTASNLTNFIPNPLHPEPNQPLSLTRLLTPSSLIYDTYDAYFPSQRRYLKATRASRISWGSV